MPCLLSSSRACSFDSLLNFSCRTRPACEKLACGSHKFGKFVIGGGFATGTCSGCGQSMLVCVCAKGFFGCIDAGEFQAVLSKLDGEAEGTKELHSKLVVEDEEEEEKEEEEEQHISFTFFFIFSPSSET